MPWLAGCAGSICIVNMGGLLNFIFNRMNTNEQLVACQNDQLWKEGRPASRICPTCLSMDSGTWWYLPYPHFVHVSHTFSKWPHLLKPTGSWQVDSGPGCLPNQPAFARPLLHLAPLHFGTFEILRQVSTLQYIILCILYTQYGFWLRHLLSLVPESLSFGRVVACALCDTAAHQCVCAWRMWSLHGLGESTRVVPLSAPITCFTSFYHFSAPGLIQFPKFRTPRLPRTKVTENHRDFGVTWPQVPGLTSHGSTVSGVLRVAPRRRVSVAPRPDRAPRPRTSREDAAPAVADTRRARQGGIPRFPMVSPSQARGCSRVDYGQLVSAICFSLILFILFLIWAMNHTHWSWASRVDPTQSTTAAFFVRATGNLSGNLIHDLYRILQNSTYIILYATEVKEIHRQSPPHCRIAFCIKKWSASKFRSMWRRSSQSELATPKGTGRQWKWFSTWNRVTEG